MRSPHDDKQYLCLPSPKHRIVAKVDELMTLCDRLKADLIDARTRQARNVADNASGGALRKLGWQDFERLEGEAFRMRGYAVTETGGGGADGGARCGRWLRGHLRRVHVRCQDLCQEPQHRAD